MKLLAGPGPCAVVADGKLLLDVDVTGSVDAGGSGVAMYRTRADIDDVVVSPAQLGTIYRSDFTDTDIARAQSGAGRWSVRSSAGYQP